MRVKAFILFIPLFSILSSCKKDKKKIIVENISTTLGFPTYQEYLEIYEPKLDAVVNFQIEVENSTNSTLEINLSRGLSYMRNKENEDSFWLMDSVSSHELYFWGGDNELKIQPSESETFFIYMDLNNHVPKINIQDFQALKDSIYSISKKGELVFIKNKKGKEFYQDSIKVYRDENEFISRPYLPDGIDVSLFKN